MKVGTNTPICLPDITSTPTITVVPLPTCIAAYTSVDGDTCDSIATQYGITGTQIYDANTFLDCSDICTFLGLDSDLYSSSIFHRGGDINLHSRRRHP
jgi:LysM domain